MANFNKSRLLPKWPQNKNFNIKFNSQLINKAIVLKLVGRLYLGKNTHILLNGFVIDMDQFLGLFWQQPAIGKVAI